MQEGDGVGSAAQTSLYAGLDAGELDDDGTGMATSATKTAFTAAYESPLQCIRSYTLARQYTQVTGQARITTAHVRGVDVSTPLCLSDLTGRCYDPGCQLQHLSGLVLTNKARLQASTSIAFDCSLSRLGCCCSNFKSSSARMLCPAPRPPRIGRQPSLLMWRRGRSRPWTCSPSVKRPLTNRLGWTCYEPCSLQQVQYLVDG